MATPACERMNGTATRAVSPHLLHASQVIVLAALYFGVAKLSLLTAISPGYATSVWPPSGLALAVVLLLGRRMWPGIWIGAALVNLTVQSSIVAAVLIGTGNSLEAIVGAALVRRWMGVPQRFERGEDVFQFVLIAAVASTVAATVGTLAIAIAGGISWTELPANWWTWWQGDTSGIIVIAPLILTWSLRGGWTPRRNLELAIFAIAIALAGYAAFGGGIATRGFSRC